MPPATRSTPLTDGTTLQQRPQTSRSPAPGLKTTTFTARDARYVRIQGVTRGTPWGYVLLEAKVYGPGGGPPPPPPPTIDLALNKPATASTVETPAFTGQGGGRLVHHSLERKAPRQPVVAGRPRQRQTDEQDRAELGGRLCLPLQDPHLHRRHDLHRSRRRVYLKSRAEDGHLPRPGMAATCASRASRADPWGMSFWDAPGVRPLERREYEAGAGVRVARSQISPSSARSGVRGGHARTGNA